MSLESTNSRPTVLVVEDEPDLADLYSAWLEREYPVRTALDGEEALSELGPGVDIVLLDRRMPGLSGDEVLARIQESSVECRVAMVTAVEPDIDIIEMGFDDYLVKPISRDELLETVRELLALTTYDERIREYYALTAKRTALTANKRSDEIAESEEYDSLVGRLHDVRDEFEELRNQLDYDQLQHAFSVIDFEDAPPGESRVDEY